MFDPSMKIRFLHSFSISPREAVRIQSRLAAKISLHPFSRQVRRIGGADVSYDPLSNRFFAAFIVLAWPGLDVIEIARAQGRVTFPYVPGLLSFREIPPLLKAFRRLSGTPDLLLCDGQGLAHPRFLGLACHLGLFLGIPTIGCAKSLLVGEHGRVPVRRGGRALLTHKGRQVGFALRTRQGVREIIVSPGHRVSIAQAAEWTLRCTLRCRIPEPTRLADLEVTRMRRAELTRTMSLKHPKRLC